MPTLFLVLSVVGLLYTLNAFRPLRIEVLSVGTFFAGWLTSELPLHHLAWQVLATAALVLLGALDRWPGWVGLGLTLLSWSGLVALAVKAARADEVVEGALRQALGEGYRAQMSSRLVGDDQPRWRWWRMAIPFGRGDKAVEKVANIDYAGDGRKAHRLDVYRPRDRRQGCPVLLYIHGGGWVLGDKREQGIPLMVDLAAHGWVCLTVNYRLSPRATFPDHLVDVKRALAWARQHVAELGGDPSYVAVSGGSAGGHLAALVAFTPNDPEYQPGFEHVDTLVQAAVPFYGVYDFTNRDGVRGMGFGRFLERMVMKVKLSEDPEAWAKASPVDRIGDEVPPFFVIHGSNDTLVPVAEARRFVELLRERSKTPVAYAELPGAQHAFEIFRSVRTAHVVQGVERFLAHCYGTRVEQAGQRSVRQAG